MSARRSLSVPRRRSSAPIMVVCAALSRRGGCARRPTGAAWRRLLSPVVCVYSCVSRPAGVRFGCRSAFDPSVTSTARPPLLVEPLPLSRVVGGGLGRGPPRSPPSRAAGLRPPLGGSGLSRGRVLLALRVRTRRDPAWVRRSALACAAAGIPLALIVGPTWSCGRCGSPPRGQSFRASRPGVRVLCGLGVGARGDSARAALPLKRKGYGTIRLSTAATVAATGRPVVRAPEWVGGSRAPPASRPPT